MKTKAEVLTLLNERRKSIAASCWGRDKSNKEAIQRTIDALDSSYSYYTVLSAGEREQVRTEWLELAEHLGMQITKRRVSRSVPTLPPEVQAFFGDAACIPHFPRATDNYERGMRAMPWSRAQNLRSIELNPCAQIYWLVFDCDHNDLERWKTAGLPEPSFITINPENQHHHIAYRLAAPVCRSERGRTRPLAFLRAVYEGLRLSLEADPSYAGVLTKNPLHPAWLTVRPTVMPSYSLTELAATVDLRHISVSGRAQVRAKPQINMANVAVGGRNRALFDAVRVWAHRNPESLDDILEFAEQCNAHLMQPLGFNEVTSIVRSIERYMTGPRKNSGQHINFSVKQSARGKLGGRPQTTLSSQPWLAAGISRSTWYYRQKNEKTASAETAVQSLPSNRGGRPATTKDSKPWLAKGISRTTWYRQREGTGAPNRNLEPDIAVD